METDLAQLEEQGRSPLLPGSTTASSPSSSGPDCSLCGGEGYFRAPGGMRLCGCLREKRILRELPPLYHRATLADFNLDVRDRIEDWARDPGCGLLLAGGTGTGKTYLAAAVLRRHMEQGHRAAFRRCPEFYSALRDVYRTGDAEASVTEPLYGTPLLVLDDVGAGSLSDYERRSTLEVLDQRMNRMLPTVVTTNWSIGKIAELLDERIASRLAAFTALELQGHDQRLRH